MQFLIALPFLFSISFTLGQSYPQPPKPRLNNPIDYVAWLNKTYGGSIKVNAADKYKAAFDAYVAPSPETLSKKWARGLDRSDEGGPNTAAGWVLANKRSLRLFREATEIRDCYFPRTPTESRLLGDVLQPYLSCFRVMSTLLYTKARGQFDSGNVDGAIDDLILILQSARHLYAQPSMLEYLTSHASLRLAYRAMIDWLTSGDRPLDYDSTLRRFIHEEMPLAVPRRQIVMDKAVCWDMLQKMSIVDGQETGLKTQDDLDIAVAELERLVKPYYGLYTEEYTKARKLSEELEKLDGGFTSETTKDGTKSTDTTGKFLILSKIEDHEPGMSAFLTSGLWKIAVLHRKLMVERNAAYTLLAINAYKAKHGHWPKSLAVAMPGAFAAYRTDPFSGKDLVYRLDEGKPVLYSVGLDGKDDGGKRTPKSWSETGDEVFLPGPRH